MKKIFLLIFILFLNISSVFGADNAEVTINSRVDKSKVYMDGKIIYTVIITGKKGLEGNPVFPDFKGFQASFRGNSKSFTVINGDMTVSNIYTYVLSPLAPGKYTISAAQFNIDGQVFASQTLDVEVFAGESPSRMNYGHAAKPDVGYVEEGPNEGDSQFFIILETDKKECFINEQVTMTFKFCRQGNLLSDPQYDPPVVSGFWKEDLQAQSNDYELINGKKYMVTSINTALFPMKTGELEIGPASLHIEFLANNIRSAMDDEDYFFGGMFGFDISKKGILKILKTKPLKIAVIPLPAEDKPKDFSGVVGDFRIKAYVDKDKVKTGDSFTWIVELTGEGNFNSIKLPTLPNMDDFEVYPSDNGKIELKKTGKRVEGKVKYEIVLVPKVPGDKTISKINFSYYDPYKAQYQTISTDPIKIFVEKSKDYNPDKKTEILDFTKNAGTEKTQIQVMRDDIRYLKQDLGELYKKWEGAAAWWFVFFYLVFPLVILIKFLIILKKEKEKKDVGFYRKRNAYKNAKANLEKAEHVLKNKEEFYQKFSLALKGYIADKFLIAESEVTCFEIDRCLSQINISKNEIAEFVNLLESSEGARYALSVVSHEEMVKQYKQAKELIKKIENK